MKGTVKGGSTVDGGARRGVSAESIGGVEPVEAVDMELIDEAELVFELALEFIELAAVNPPLPPPPPPP